METGTKKKLTRSDKMEHIFGTLVGSEGVPCVSFSAFDFVLRFAFVLTCLRELSRNLKR